MGEDLLAEVSRALAHINPVWLSEAHWDDQWYAKEARAVLARAGPGATPDAVKRIIAEVFTKTWPTFWEESRADPEFLRRLDEAAEYIARRHRRPAGS